MPLIICNLLYETWRLYDQLKVGAYCSTVVVVLSIIYLVLQKEPKLRLVLMYILCHTCLSMWITEFKQHWNMLLLKLGCNLCYTSIICYICMSVGYGGKTESLFKKNKRFQKCRNFPRGTYFIFYLHQTHVNVISSL